MYIPQTKKKWHIITEEDLKTVLNILRISLSVRVCSQGGIVWRKNTR